MNAKRLLTLKKLHIGPAQENDDGCHSSDSDRSGTSIGSTSQHVGAGDENFVEELSDNGIPDIVVDVDDDDECSAMTLDEKSYVLDLGRQKVTREDEMKAEAFEDAHMWYQKALKEGMPESTELFGSIFSQLYGEIKGKYKEYHKKQDQWLDEALDALEARMNEELEAAGKPKNDINTLLTTKEDKEKEELKKKIKKVEKILVSIENENGKDSKEYRAYERKLEGYKKQLVGAPPSSNFAKKKKTKKGSTSTVKSKRASKGNETDHEVDEKKNKRRSRSVKATRIRSIFSGDEKIKKESAGRSRSKSKDKKEKRRSKSSTTLRNKVKARRSKVVDDV